MRRCHRIYNINRMDYIKPIWYIFLLLTVFTYATCPDNCDDCDESGMICFTCSGDYQVNVFGGCHANTIDKCIIYGPSDQCFRCQPTYSLVNGACVKIFNGCVNEGNPDQCFECAFGLTLSGSTCSGVINCADFSGGKCNKCKEGFNLSQKICKDTSDGCASTRSTDGICNKCKDGYFQSGYQCFKQKQRNKRCYVQDWKDKCPYCKSGYNGVNGKCLLNKQMSGAQPAPSSADSFSQSSEGSSFGFSEMTSTASSSSFNSGVSQSFGAQPSLGSDPFGFGSNTKPNQSGDSFSSDTGFPQPIKIDNCQVPDPIGNGCIVCVYGWFPINKGCQPVSPLCDGHNVQTGQCFACINQLTLDSGKCIDKNCESFNNNACLVCKTGFKVNQNNVCKLFDPNCLDSQKGKCQKCKQDFYIDISGLCKPLPPFCLAANVQTGSCLQCVKDYQIVSQGAPCTKKIFIENCQVYDTKNIGKCLICLQRYYPDDKKCSKVSNLCKDYNPQNGNCISCAIQGFTLGNGICSDSNCLSRSNDEICTNCKQNFIFNNSEKICKLNDPNCKNIAISSCLQCKAGFYITNQKICKALPLNCQTADVTGKCIMCLDRFYNSDSSCQPFSPTCNSYNAVNGKCTSCNSNMVLQPDGSCAVAIQIIGPVPIPQIKSSIPIQPVNQKPNPIVIPQTPQTSPRIQITTGSNTNTVIKSDLNCRQYNGNKCIKCSTRYYVGFDGRCVPVNPLCKQSNSAGQCTLCYPGYKIDKGKCIIANSNDPNCKTFLNQQCSQCYQGFYFNQNDKICKKLNPLCKTSNLFNGSCTSCYNGYNVNPTSGNCQIFFKDSNCKQFNPDGTTCKLCSNRYYINANGKCSAANPICKNFNANTGACTACYPGYGLRNNLCVAGVSSDPNCKNPEGTGCKQCVNGFYLNNEGKCAQASPLCKTFDKKNGNCLSCYNGYTILNGACIISQTQDPNCKKTNTQNDCLDCYHGYIVIKGKCIAQNPLCKGLDKNTGGCTSCWPGYTLTPDANCSLQQAIQNPSANDPYCIKVNNGVCTQCSSGYYYNRDQGLCSQFDPICKTSDKNTGACQTCYQGYIISGTQCIPAPTIQIPNCLTVEPSGQCAECVEGNYLNKQKNCVQVSILCAGYNKQTGDCTSCVTGYFFQDNSCVFPSIYDQNCIRYENSYCSQCRPGFYLSNFVCQPIDPNCTNFNFNTLSCETCANNMFTNGPNCE